MADNYAPRRQQVLNICRAQCEAVVRPDRVSNDLARVTKAFQARHVGQYVHTAMIPQSQSAEQLGNIVPVEGRAVGSILAVAPEWEEEALPALPYHPDDVLTPLARPGVAISAVAPARLALRRLLTQGLNTLGSPWMI